MLLTPGELTYLATYGYLATFILVTLSSMSAFIPAGILLIAAGALARAHYLSLWIELPIATIASSIGDVFVFGIARRLGRHEAYRRYVDGSKFASTVEDYMQKYPRATVLISRFIGFIGTPVDGLAGLSQISHADFILFDLIGNAICCLAYLGAGYYLGAAWDYDARIASYILIGTALLAVIGYTLAYLRARRR